MAPKKKTPAKSSTPGVPVKSVTPAKKIAKSPKTTVSEPKTLFCPRCSMGPMNKAGLAMHEARWCKKKDRPAAPPGNLGDLADDDDVTIAELAARTAMGRKKGSKNKPKSTSAPVVDLTAADDDDGPLASLAVVDLTRADDDAPTPAVLTNANANANAKKRKRANAPAPTASIAAASPPPRPMQRPERADESLAETTTTTTTIRLDDDDDDELASVVCFGAMASAIVGIQYYNGIVSRKEQVTLHREPRNQYDRNALRVDNVRREQVGHIPRDVAAHLSPLIDAKKIHHVVGVVTSGTNNRYRMPVSVFLYGRESDRAHVTQRLRNGGVRLGLADGVASKVI